MEMHRLLRPAHPGEESAILTVLEAAKGIMRSDGNLRQWVGGYPDESVISRDIASGCGIVICENDRIVGYFAFIPSPEPTYLRIYDGQWLDDIRPYHVIHRIGGLPGVHGIFRTMLAWCDRREPNLRIDTHRDNRIMQHNLLKHGFFYCGIIYLANGDERLAYQRIRPAEKNLAVI